MPRPHSAVFPLVLVLALVALTSGAHAQGTFGSLPDPISSNDLEGYAERLSLSDQQRLAISEHHAQYLQQFRQLRDGEIDRFLQQMQSMRRRFDPTRIDEFAPIVKDLARLMGRIRNLDEQFFSGMQAVLTEAQAADLPRIRQARERARYGSDVTRLVDFINPSVRIDLTEQIDRLNLTDEQAAEIDPILLQYEHRLTSGARKLFETTISAITTGIRRMEELGFTPVVMEDRRQIAQFFETAQQVWDEVTVDVQKEAAGLSALHRQTCRTLTQLLPRAQARELRRQYFNRAYREAARIGQTAERRFDAALALESLPVEKRNAIEALAQSHLSVQDQRADRIADLIDELRQHVSLRELVRRNRNNDRAEIVAIREQADKADEQAIASLHAILGEEYLAKLTGAADGASIENDGTVTVAIRTADGTIRTEAARVEGIAAGPGRVRLGNAAAGAFPPPITPEDLDDYAELIGLNENQWTILDSLYESYRTTLLSTREALMERIRTASEAARAAAGQDGRRLFAAGGMDELATVREEGFDTIRAIDEAFFDDIAVAVIEPDQREGLKRVRESRERASYLRSIGRVPSFSFQGGPGGPRGRFGSDDRISTIDLSAVARSLDLLAEAPTSFDDALRRYEFELTPLLRQHHEANRDLRKAMQQMRPEEGEAENRRERMQAMAEVMRRVGRRSQEASEAIENLNRSAVETLAAALPMDLARDFRLAFHRQAYPDVYGDDATAGPRLSQALSLPGLTPVQRSRLQEALMEHQRQYDALSMQMIEVHQRRPSAEDAAGDRRENRIARDNARAELERLRFERNEVNERALLQLRAVLTEDQLAALDAPEEFEE